MIDVNVATMNSRPMDKRLNNRSLYPDWDDNTRAWKTCVRDVSWHPSAPVLASTLSLIHQYFISALIKFVVNHAVGIQPPVGTATA